MGCGQCTTYLQHHESSWNSSGKYYSYQPCGQTSCVEWLLETVKKKLVEKNVEIEVENKTMKETLRFLRHKLDNEQKLGIRDGDVVIIVEGFTDQPLHAHKVILASRSPVFQKVFETDMQEKESGILRINDASLQVVRVVIKFCYNAEIEFTDEGTSEAVLEVAHKYDLDLLRKICVEDLTGTINGGNLPKRLKLARKFESIGLEAAAYQFFKRNFDSHLSCPLRILLEHFWKSSVTLKVWFCRCRSLLGQYFYLTVEKLRLRLYLAIVISQLLILRKSF